MTSVAKMEPMSKSPSNPTLKDKSPANLSGADATKPDASPEAHIYLAPGAHLIPPKSKVEKTQSLLSLVSTTIGLIGVAGSVFAFATATFYTGSVEVKPDRDVPGVVVKVYTKEGHESVFHAKHIDLMPGSYHLEISAPDSKVVHYETKVRFHKTSTVPISLTPAQESKQESAKPTDENAEVSNETGDNSASTDLAHSPFFAKQEKESEGTPKKRHWWQFWKRSANDANGNGGKE